MFLMVFLICCKDRISFAICHKNGTHLLRFCRQLRVIILVVYKNFVYFRFIGHSVVYVQDVKAVFQAGDIERDVFTRGDDLPLQDAGIVIQFYGEMESASRRLPAGR